MNALQAIGQLPLSRAVIISFFISGIYYLVGYDSGETFKNAMISSEQSKTELKTEIAKLDKELESIRQLKAAQDRDSERLNTLLAFIPEKLTKTELMRTLGNEAKSVGVSINQIRDNTNQNKKSEFYEEVGVEIELVGSFAQLVLFLSNLTNLKQIISVDGLTMIVGSGPMGESGSLVMAASILGYRYVAKNAAGPQ